MESIHKPKQVRGAYRSVATRLEREAIELVEGEACEDGDDARICRLETIEESLTTKLNELQKFDDQIIEIIKDDEIEDEILTANEYKIRISNVIRRIKRWQRKGEVSSTPAISSSRIRRQLSSIPTQPSFSTSPIQQARISFAGEHETKMNTSTHSSNWSCGNSNSKLPKLNLPRFNGDIVNFFSCWETFSTAVHEIRVFHQY